MKKLGGFWLIGLAVLAGPLWADSTEARCDIYPTGSDHASASIPCVFSQRQGAVTIARSDGVVHDLLPEGDVPGNYRDADGRPAYRNSGLGADGLIFRLQNESVYVYWSTGGLPGEAPNPDDPTAPYSTADYDATTALRCRIEGQPGRDCPAGILRMEDRQASIVVMSPAGQEFTLNFMTGYVNATGGREVAASLEGDTWQVVVDGVEHYEVPLAAIEGG